MLSAYLECASIWVDIRHSDYEAEGANRRSVNNRDRYPDIVSDFQWAKPLPTWLDHAFSLFA